MLPVLVAKDDDFDILNRTKAASPAGGCHHFSLPFLTKAVKMTEGVFRREGPGAHFCVNLMKFASHSSLSLPGELERELWQRNAQGAWERHVESSKSSGCLYAVETRVLDSLPFWAVAPQDGKVDVSGVVSLKWEFLGCEKSREGRTWTHWVAGEKDNRVLVASAGMALDSISPDWVQWSPQAFDLSPRLYPIPEGEAAIWKELGRYVWGDSCTRTGWCISQC